MLTTYWSARTATTRSAIVVLGVVGALIVGVGVGDAIGTSKLSPVWSNGTIHQCLNNKSWATRTLPQGKACKAGETGYSFNQKGSRGVPGKAGLTASAFADDGGATPLAGATRSIVKQVKITMSSPGKLLVLDATVEGATVNNVGSTNVRYYAGVYVDGVGVPGTANPSPGQIPAESGNYVVSPFSVGPGAIANVSAGTHTVSLVLFTTDTTVNYLTSGSGRLLVVATG